MINTEKHGKIPQEAGDVVLVTKPMNKYIGLITQSGVVVDKEQGFLISCKESMLTLLHRPGSPELDHSEWEPDNESGN